MKITLQQLQKQSKDFSEVTTFSQVQITPELAKVLLDLNTNNRPIRLKLVNRYAQEMQAEKWEYNGDSIRLSKTGRLLDGQHRLHAIVESNCTITTDIKVGLEDEAFKTIDVGRTRTSSDTVSFLGFKNTTVLASLVKWIISYDINKDFHSNHKAIVSNHDVGTYLSMLNNAEKAVVENASSKASGYSKKFKPISQSQAAFFWWLFSGINSNKAEEFFHLLTTGDGVGSKNQSGIYLLREKLQKIHNATTSTDLNIRNALIIKAWNLFVTKTDVKQLHWDDRQDFPKVIRKW